MLGESNISELLCQKGEGLSRYAPNPKRFINDSQEFYYCMKMYFTNYNGDDHVPFCQYAYGNYSGIFSKNLFESGCQVENKGCK